jgi:hypothetical protein
MEFEKPSNNQKASGQNTASNTFKTSPITLKNKIQTVEEKYKGMTRNDVQSTLEKLSKR